MKILALDLGSRTGWAIWTGAQKISGWIDFKPGRHEGAGMQFVRFRNWLMEMQSKFAPEVIYYEEVRRHLGTDAAHSYGGFWATLTAFCQESKIPFKGVPVGTIKKHATGKGNSGKEEMIQAACAMWGEKKDSNEVDALWLLDFVEKEI